ncbi:zinc finger BED domain-containing protein RICESLEEPER 2-like protein [Tanacetum coccineum]
MRISRVKRLGVKQTQVLHTSSYQVLSKISPVRDATRVDIRDAGALHARDASVPHFSEGASRHMTSARGGTQRNPTTAERLHCADLRISRDVNRSIYTIWEQSLTIDVSASFSTRTRAPISHKTERPHYEYVEMHDELVREAAIHKNRSCGGSTNSRSNEDLVGSEWEEFGDFYKGADVEKCDKSELKMYLEEGLLEGHWGTKFNALEWWSVHQLKYPILSKMAKDVLAIPISTVASEATFSAGGIFIDPYRSALKSSTVEMLLCMAAYVPLRVPWPGSIIVFSLVVKKTDGDVRCVQVMQPEGLNHAMKLAMKIDENKAQSSSQKFNPGHRCAPHTLQVMIVDDSDAENEPYLQIQMVAMMSNPKRENVDKVYKEEEEILRNVKVEAIDTVDTNAVVHGMQQVTKAILLKLMVAITTVEAFMQLQFTHWLRVSWVHSFFSA